MISFIRGFIKLNNKPSYHDQRYPFSGTIKSRVPAMNISTNLHGRLRNTSLPASNGMHPLYEAVANAIHAIEDAGIPQENGFISVKIVRHGQTLMGLDEGIKRPGPEAKDEIIGFRITDNGVGFTDENMESFLTLDSEHKANRGARGVGRLLWLKAFDRASIISVYASEEGILKKRSFTFDARQGVSEPIVEEIDNESRWTDVYLEGFSSRYRQASPKTASIIARNLFEHNLWYFIRPGGAPTIKVIDNDEVILLDQVYEEQMIAAGTESFDLKGTRFDLIHIKLSALSGRGHSIAYCASNRVVTQDLIKGKIAGLYGGLADGERDFFYECYVSSPLLDERVRSERTSFDIEENPLDLFESVELSQREIRDAVLIRVSNYLSAYLDETRRLGRERVSEFVANKAPRYRPILDRIPNDQLAVDPDINDKELDLLLHRHLSEIESRLLEDGHDIMAPKANESYSDYSIRVQDYLKTVQDVKKSDLANYVSHRRVILDFLEKAIERQSDGKYAREDLIHNLIMPMGSSSNELHFDTCNLWLVDERLAFHDYLASDKTLAAMPITSSNETKEPDLIAFNVFDTPVLVSESKKPPLTSIVIVELKRPMRNDAAAGEDKDPIEQALGYLERIRNGTVQTQGGRPIRNAADIPGFCYAICDITPTIERRCKLLGLTQTHDYSGYFGYNPNYKAYLEVISFDRLVNSAKERNKAFFDKLGLPTK